MLSRNRWLGWMVLAGAAVVLGGCSPKAAMKAFNVDVDIARERLEGSTVRVDLVGVNSAGYSRWSGKSVDTYWEPGDPLRSSAKNLGMVYEMRFATVPSSQRLSKSDPIWSTWAASDVFWVFVFADLPTEHDDQPGEFTVDRTRYPRKTKTIDISIQSVGVFVRTAPLPAATQ